MNERDELADLIATEAVKNVRETEIRRCAPDGETPVFDIDEQIADAILAAGYRKSRTITTAEELDALEAGTPILCQGDRTGENGDQILTLAPAKPPATGYQWRNHWITYFGNGVLDDFETITVLWEPK